MKRNLVLNAFALAVLTAILASTAGTVAAAPVSQHVTLTGYITCTSCMEPNACKAQTRASCTQWWVGQGASYVLVAGESHYMLSGAQKELAKAAFENTVTISGDLNGNTVEVSTVDFSHKVK